MSKLIIERVTVNSKSFRVRLAVNDEIVSYGFLIIHKHETGENHAIIEEVFTELEHRNKGYASKVISELINIAKLNNCYKIVLQCEDKNIHLYAKHGFKKHQNAMRLSL